jgi:integrase
MSNFPTAKVAERVPDLDVPIFWRIVNQTTEFVRCAYVTIACLGLRVGEYLRLQDTDLLPATHQIRIPGTYKWLREYWVRARKAVGAGDVRLHDLRHLTAQALVNAGRSEASVQSTMQHVRAQP